MNIMYTHVIAAAEMSRRSAAPPCAARHRDSLVSAVKAVPLAVGDCHCEAVLEYLAASARC